VSARVPTQTLRDLEIASILQLLNDLSASSFWGSLELKFEAGRIVLVRKSETIKPNEYPRNNRGFQYGTQQ
jgi:hypothetical protein